MPLVDSHVHLFPDRLFAAIWDWFDNNAWPIVDRLDSDSIVSALAAKGVSRAVAFPYAHCPGIADSLNSYMADLAQGNPLVVPLGTVFPGEPGEEEILERAFSELGLRGIKLHCHVQGVSPDSELLRPTCEAVERHAGVLVIHAGTAPSLPSMADELRSLCGARRTRGLLQAHPLLKVVVPHLGMAEYEEFRELLEEFPNLHLDTAMAVGGFFGNEPPLEDLEGIAGRVLFGSDFPNLPYRYERELEALKAGLSEEALDAVLWRNADSLFDLRLDGHCHQP